MNKIKHLMVIPDGDRRYGKKYGLTLDQCYEKAAEVAYDLLKWVLIENDINEYTFFGLSYSNILRRKSANLSPIFKAQTKTFLRIPEDPYFQDHGIKIKVYGVRELLPRYYQQAIEEAEEATQSCKKKVFNSLIGYSGAYDLINSFKEMRGGDLTIERLQKKCNVSTPVDLLIRTANEKRISDSPLLPLRYTEFYFTKKFFPELEKRDINLAIKEYYNRVRSFGE